MKTTKTILTLAIIAALPFAAHATDPVVAVGPAHASSNPVVATANAPYVTVTPTQTDESHIATTAYVKGAYNDAIAAVNKVDSDKQGKLMNMESTPQPISNNVLSSNALAGSMEYIGGLLGGQAVNGLQVTQDEFDAMVYDMENEIGADLDNTLPTTETVYKLIRGASDTVYTGAQSVISGLQSDLADKQDKLVSDSNHAMSNKVFGGIDAREYGRNMPEMGNEEYAQVLGDLAMQYSDLESSDPDDILISMGAVFDIVRNSGQTLQGNMQTTLNNKRVEIYTTWENDNAKQQIAFVNAQ